MSGITFRARGHPNIKARHSTTLMITKDPEVSPKGDCVIGVSSEKSVADLPAELKDGIRAGRGVIIELRVGNRRETVRALGHPLLKLAHTSDMVIRKSCYVCERTLAVRANVSAADLPRDFVDLLRDPNAILLIKIEVI
ncbi:MAG: DUF371 domain-containing protein [Candidatus Hadarchaeales archaeon]